MQVQSYYNRELPSAGSTIARLPLRDCAAMAQLFHQTVHQINSCDYEPAQIAAWSPAVQSAEAWRDRLQSKQALYIARSQNKILGFVELDPPQPEPPQSEPPDPNSQAHIDCFYIHHQHQRQGVGSALLAALEAGAKHQGISLLYVEASITAQPFFSHKGFRMVREQLRELRGCQFKQVYMEKPL